MQYLQYPQDCTDYGMATTDGVTKKYIHDQINDVKKTFLREISSLHETLKQNEKYVCVCACVLCV